MTPSTDDLPFLVVYGAWVWPAVAAVGLAVLGAAIWFLRRSAAVLAVRAERDRFVGEPLAEGEVMIRGTLGASEAGVIAATVRTRAFDEKRSGARDWHRALWIDTPEGRVMLDGAVRVVAGRRRRARLALPRATPAPLRAEFSDRTRYAWWSWSWIHDSTLDLLEAGDEVTARGTLARAPATAEVDYRAGEAVSMLRPLGEHLEIASTGPRASALRLSILAYAVITALVMYAAYLGVESVGGRALDRCRDAMHSPGELGHGFVELGETHACAIAASGPKSRENALDTLAGFLPRHPFRDVRTIERLLGLAELADDPRRAYTILMEAGRYDEAAQLAGAAGHIPQQLHALTLAGRFREAAAVARLDRQGYTPGSDVPLLIAAGMWEDAAASVDAYVAKRKQPADGAEPITAGLELYYRCFSDLLRHHGGDAAAAGRLLARYRAPDGAPCATAALEVARAEEKAAIVADPREDGVASRHDRALVAWRHGFWDPILGRFDRAPRTLVRLTEAFGGEAYSAFLAPHALASTLPEGADGIELYTALSWSVVWHVLEGDDVQAHELAVAAEGALTGVDPDEVDYLDGAALRPALGLYGRQLGGELAFLRDRDDVDHEQIVYGPLFLRAGQPYRSLRVTAAMLEAARARDGVRFAEALGAADLYPDDGLLIGLAPLFETGRDALRDAVVYRSRQVYGASYPFSAALATAARRELLELVDAPEVAAHWDAIYRRYADALNDPRKTVALILWN